MYGVSFPARDLHDALDRARHEDPPRAVAAAEFAPAWLLCFHYDPQTGRYTFAVMNAVRVAALLALAGLCLAIVRMVRNERRARS